MKKKFPLLFLLCSFIVGLLAQNASSQLAGCLSDPYPDCFEFVAAPFCQSGIIGGPFSLTGDSFVIDDSTTSDKVRLEANIDNLHEVDDSCAHALWHQLFDSICPDGTFANLGSPMMARPTLSEHGTYCTKPASSFPNQRFYQLILRYADGSSCRLSSDDRFICLVAQWMGDRFMILRDKFSVAYTHRNITLMRQQADEALLLIRQADSVLAYRGSSPTEQDGFERQPRLPLSASGDPVLNDDASCLWAGLLSDYYAQRWSLFFDEAILAVANDTLFDQQTFDSQLALFEHRWTTLPAPTGHPVTDTGALREQSFVNILRHIFSHYQSTDAAVAWTRITTPFPQSNLQDFYKNCFQERFGTGHLVSSDRRQTVVDYLNNECEYLRQSEHWSYSDANTPDFEYVGLEGRYVRVNLGLVVDSVLSADFLADSFIKGAFAIDSAMVADWHCRWNMMMVELQPLGQQIGSFSADSTSLQQLFAKGRYAFYHSQRFNDAYHYHYRLVRRDIFCNDILPLLQRAGRVRGTVDPLSAEASLPLPSCVSDEK